MKVLPPVPGRAELLFDCPAEALWPLISNTNRLNRALGLPDLSVKGSGAARDYSLRVNLRKMGLGLTWREEPFEWVEGRYFTLVRIFEGGPLARWDATFTLTPEGRGCRLQVKSDFTPRSAIAGALIRYVVLPKSLRDLRLLLRRFEASVKADGQLDAFPRRTKTPTNEQTLESRAAALRAAAEPKTAARLIELLRDGHDDELTRMRPFELADRWGEDRLETLKAFLHAVKAGLLDLAWEISCRNCASSGSYEKLEKLTASSHCPSCDLAFGVDLADNVELRFSVQPAVRKAVTALFCAGSPAHTPFAAAQLSLDPIAPRSLNMTLGSESYIVRNLAERSTVRLRPKSDGASRFEFGAEGETEVQELGFKPGLVTLRFAPGSALVRVEKESWKDKGAKASVVTALQDFRRLFSSEVLSPGVEIGIRNIAMMFTDLKDSTALYEKIGDATAYSVVRSHFDYLFEIVARHDGAVVKTIGDAVMAVFDKGSDAMAAALEIQERMAELNEKLAPRPPVVIKLGLHQGAAIAINQNAVLDYFGTTVNVAARVQNESRGADIVMTESLRLDPGVASLLAARSLAVEPFKINLKGLSEAFQLWRFFPKASI